MKLSCTKQALSQGLAIVNHAVAARSTLPILSHILLETDHGRLKLSATDLEMRITCWVEADIDDAGSVTLPAKLTTEFVNSLPPGTVELVLKEAYTLHVKGGRSSANIRGMNPEEFPLTSSAEEDTSPIQIDAQLLKEVIGQVAFAATTDISRPVLTAVLLKASEEEITFAAADSFRLAVRVVPLALSSPPSGQILIPAHTLSELARILPEEGEVQILILANRSQILFHTEHIDVFSRLIEGNFPNYEQIIPREHTTNAVLNTHDFAGAMKTASLFARDDANRAYLTIRKETHEGVEVAQDSLLIEAGSEEVGGGEGRIDAQITGEGLESRIILDARYLVQVLAVLNATEIALQLTKETRPVVIKPIGATNFTYILMPMSKQH